MVGNGDGAEGLCVLILTAVNVACRRVVSQRARVPAHSRFSRPGGVLRLCLVLTSFGSWRRSSTPWRHLRVRSLEAFTPCWFSPRGHGATPCAFSAPALLLLVALSRAWVNFAQRARLSNWPGSQFPLERIRISRIRSGSPAFAPVLQEPVEPVSTVRAPSLPAFCGAPASLHPPLAQPTRQNPSDSAEARRSRDKRRRRARKQAKRSIWRESLKRAVGLHVAVL